METLTDMDLLLLVCVFNLDLPVWVLQILTGALPDLPRLQRGETRSAA
jgi:hypothetical protein